MSQSRKIAIFSSVGVLLVAGVSFAVWKANLVAHQPVQVDQLEDEAEEPLAEHFSDNFLNEERARFKTKSGVEVVMSSYSECEACDSPEFIGLQTEQDSQMNSIPSPQEHNFSETPEAHMRTTIIYGQCSDEVVSYQELQTGKAAPSGGKVAPEYTKYVATVLPSGNIKIKKETLTASTFEKMFKATAPRGCEILHQDDVYAAGI